MADDSDARRLFDRIVRDGFKEIDALLKQRRSEQILFDFKVSVDGKHPVSKLTPDGVKALAKNISGFANSSGGLLIWGVEKRDDSPGLYRDIPDVYQFEEDLNRRELGLCEPVVSGIQHLPVPRGPDDPSGIVITYIPKSSTLPHQDTQSHIYWIRSGSNTSAANDTVVRALIKYKEFPDVAIIAKITHVAAKALDLGSRELGNERTIRADISLENCGVVAIRDLFFGVEIGKHMQFYVHGHARQEQTSSERLSEVFKLKDSPLFNKSRIALGSITLKYTHDSRQSSFCRSFPANVAITLWVFAGDYSSSFQLHFPIQEMIDSGKPAGDYEIIRATQ